MAVPFVGRRAELQALNAIAGRPRREQAPAAAVISGEPGAGKSRLLDELLTRVPLEDLVRASGFEPMQSIPLAGVAPLLRRLVAVPEAGRTLDRLAFGAGSSDLLGVFEAAHRALAALGELALVLDDVQWLDDPSVGLIRYLVGAAGPARLPMLLIAAGRPSRATAALGEYLKIELPPQRALSIQLQPLEAADGVALVRAIDPALPPAQAEELWRQAGGSPFWLEALVGRTVGVASDPVAERMRALSADAGELLAMLAVAGRPVATADVGELLSWESPRLRFAAGELASHGLVHEAAGGLQPIHDLIRDAAREGIPKVTARQFHERLAVWIEAAAGDDVQALTEALEHRVAAELSAEAVATRLLTSPQRKRIGAETLRLVAGLAASPELDRLVADVAQAVGETELALERWKRAGADLEAVHCALKLGRRQEAHEHLETARRRGADGVRRDALEAQVALWLDHATARGAELAQRALEAARRSPGDRAAYLLALEAAADAALQERRADDFLDFAEEAVELARDLDEESYLAALTRSGLVHYGRLRLAESAARYRTAWDLSRRLLLPQVIVESGNGLARSLADLGRLAEARQIAEETAALDSRLRLAHPRLASATVLLHGIEAICAELMPALEALMQAARRESDPHVRLGIRQTLASWQARTRGRRASEEVARELTTAAAEAEEAGCPRCTGELLVVSAELYSRVGLVAEGQRSLAAWEKRFYRRGDLVDEHLRDRALAALAFARGHTPTAVELLERTAFRLAGHGAVIDRLWALLDLAAAQATLDRPRAVEAAEEAARTAEEIGALTHSRLAARTLRRLGIRAWRRSPGQGSTLTRRESEVTGLAAQGRSNAEIAEALALSPKTVERHLTNVLAKLGVRNRTELAALVRVSPDDRLRART